MNKLLYYGTSSGNIQIEYPSYLEWIMKFFFKRVKIKVLTNKQFKGARFASIILDESVNTKDLL